jgi:hypothetical protein
MTSLNLSRTIFRTLTILSHALIAPTLLVANVSAQTAATTSYARPELLVETAWLAANLSDSKLRILDVRPADKAQQGHIPGAKHVDCPPNDRVTLTAPASPLPGP